MRRKRLGTRIKSILFNMKFILAMHIALGIAGVSFLVFNYFFGVGILTNAHLGYLRYIMKDVVKVTDITGEHGGTGWVTSETASKVSVIITNAHVCGVADKLGFLYITNGGRTVREKIIKKSTAVDLCAITNSAKSSKGLSLAKSVNNGEAVYAAGHPYLEPDTITSGELSGLMRIPIAIGPITDLSECTGPDKEIAFDPREGLLICFAYFKAESSSIIALPGNSGSPTVNIYGHVVAVVFAANQAGTRSYHVPLADIKEFLRGL